MEMFLLQFGTHKTKATCAHTHEMERNVSRGNKESAGDFAGDFKYTKQHLNNVHIVWESGGWTQVGLLYT
jgi:hypothetical protein